MSMTNRWLGWGVLTLVLGIAAWGQTPGFLFGQRVLMDAYNCYPYEGQRTDRVDRALFMGMRVGIEIDLN